ncbi:MATE family efflux transporter [Ruminococcus sp. 5_1_39BFAA]|uniref:MATE family efflux transporter n=1 Tax=Ruminococcus sp. 5_1_39BFAA TaxID=457412 RepID=UPI0035691057
MQTDMTVGKPMKILLNFMIPVFIGNVFQQFYNMVDAIIVGKFVGTKALAAVGSTGTIMFLILGFLLGLTTGFTVLTSQKFGAGKMDEMRQTVGNAAILSVVVSIIMTAVSMIGMRSLLEFMNTPEDIFQEAYSYIMIICGGIFAQVLYNILASILRALGNSKIPLYFLILSALLNIVLDLVFIVVFHMGAAGAAWATVISQGVSGLLCLLYIIKAVPELHLCRDDWKFRKKLAGNQIRLGIPMGLQFSITAIGAMMVQSALNILGAYPVAAFTAGSKIENIFAQAFVALGTAVSTYNAQNIGAGKLENVRQGFRSADVIGVIYAVITGAILILWGKYFSYLFISDNVDTVIPMVHTYLKCVGCFMIPLYIVNCYRNGFQGMGYGFLPMLSGVAELVGRGVTAVIAAKKESYFLACMASPVAWIVATTLLIFMYFFVMKDMKKKLRL